MLHGLLTFLILHWHSYCCLFVAVMLLALVSSSLSDHQYMLFFFVLWVFYPLLIHFSPNLSHWFFYILKSVDGDFLLHLFWLLISPLYRFYFPDRLRSVILVPSTLMPIIVFLVQCLQTLTFCMDVHIIDVQAGEWVGHAAHMCPVHVNNATSCRGLEGFWLSASLHRRREEEEVGVKTDRGTKEGVNWLQGRRRRRRREEVAVKPEGVVSGDKARQMGQTKRQRLPPCMSTTPTASSMLMFVECI